MFEDLYRKSVEYDDHLLQAACVVIAEFDLDHDNFRILKHTTEFKRKVREVAKEYQVSIFALKARIQDVVED